MSKLQDIYNKIDSDISNATTTISNLTQAKSELEALKLDIETNILTKYKNRLNDLLNNIAVEFDGDNLVRFSTFDNYGITNLTDWRIEEEIDNKWVTKLEYVNGNSEIDDCVEKFNFGYNYINDVCVENGQLTGKQNGIQFQIDSCNMALSLAQTNLESLMESKIKLQSILSD